MARKERFPAKAPRKANCSSSPEAAVECFVKNALSSGLTTLPSDMTLPDYKAYGVSVSEIVRTPNALLFLLGSMAAVADVLPPLNAAGVTSNQLAQDTAVSDIVDAALRAGLPSTACRCPHRPIENVCPRPCQLDEPVHRVGFLFTIAP